MRAITQSIAQVASIRLTLRSARSARLEGRGSHGSGRGLQPLLTMKPERSTRLSVLDELDCFAARAFDHHGAGVAQRIGFLQKRDAVAA